MSLQIFFQGALRLLKSYMLYILKLEYVEYYSSPKPNFNSIFSTVIIGSWNHRTNKQFLKYVSEIFRPIFNPGVVS